MKVNSALLKFQSRLEALFGKILLRRGCLAVGLDAW
jgi:hypothetical protein